MWKSIDIAPPTEVRVLAFSPAYPVGHDMRFRVVDSRFLKIMGEVTHWMELEPNAPGPKSGTRH